MASKVYWSDLRTPEGGDSLLRKLQKLLKISDFESVPFDGKIVAIKMHFGEPGNLAFLRPNWAKTVADAIKAKGGRPFLTDCNTLYPGRRKDALEHLESAQENGFTPQTTGCQVIIADGLRGTEEALVPVKGGEYVKEAKIGAAIMEADVFVSLSHFKGHEATGFGGALKNIGMGSGSRAGKMEQHADGKPVVDEALCVGCGRCERNCGQNAIAVVNGKSVIDYGKCAGCGRCIGACPKDAIAAGESSSNEMLCRKMAEYAKAVCDGRPCYHIAIITDVSPVCDCYGSNDMPIVPNIGMFVSSDPVALDQACADAVNAAPVIPNSLLSDELGRGGHEHADHFHVTNPNTHWQDTLDHAEKIGLGTREYELIKL